MKGNSEQFLSNAFLKCALPCAKHTKENLKHEFSTRLREKGKKITNNKTQQNRSFTNSNEGGAGKDTPFWIYASIVQLNRPL